MLTLVNETKSWRTVLRQNFTHWEKLSDFLELSLEQREHVLKFTRFPLNLPFRLAEKIEKRTLDDPILKQFLPINEEMDEQEGFTPDPVGQNQCKKAAKLIHKYQGRVLLMCTSACAMHCRYCYRRHFPYECEDKTFEEEIALIEQDSSIKEVILSGGDPLSLDDRILGRILERLESISHVRRIRFHSRFPIGIPERIDANFLSLLEGVTKKIWFVIHCNHPKELDEDVLAHLSSLRDRGVNLLNQSVLLKGVNDEVEVLQDLCEKLVDHHILPYYLHQLDRVQGAAHFEVSDDRGREIVKELTNRLSGYAVPKYVREVPGKPYKLQL